MKNLEPAEDAFRMSVTLSHRATGERRTSVVSLSTGEYLAILMTSTGSAADNGEVQETIGYRARDSRSVWRALCEKIGSSILDAPYQVEPTVWTASDLDSSCNSS